jgi:DNA-binding GntR family transcriptional regulator
VVPNLCIIGLCDRGTLIRVRLCLTTPLTGPYAYPKREINTEHANLSEAVLERDSKKTVSLLIDHYSSTGELLRKNIEKRTKGIFRQT